MKTYWWDGGVAPRIPRLGSRWREWSASRLLCFTLYERTPLPIRQEAVWAPELYRYLQNMFLKMLSWFTSNCIALSQPVYL